MAAHQSHSGGSPSFGATSQQQRQNNPGQSNSALAEVKQTTQRAGEQIKDSTQSTVDSLREQGEGFFSEQTAKASSSLTSLSSAIRDAADKLRSDDNSQAAQYARLAADKLDGAARFIGQQNVGSLLSEVERAARRRPELFLGGMFLLGLGVSRFLKASSQSSNSRDWRS